MNLNALFTLIFRAMSVDQAPAEPPHVPVMLDQVLETLAPRDGDHPAVGGGEDRPAVAAGAEGAVDIEAAIAGRERL